MRICAEESSQPLIFEKECLLSDSDEQVVLSFEETNGWESHTRARNAPKARGFLRSVLRHTCSDARLLGLALTGERLGGLDVPAVARLYMDGCGIRVYV